MTCIIIEDEIPAQNVLKNYISKLNEIEIKGIFKTCVLANSFLNTNTTDIIFLDINLPDISGLDFIKTINNPPLVIMTTAYPNYAVTSFELDTIVDYLVKPFSFERFLKSINKAKKIGSKITKNSQKETILLNVDKTLYKIQTSDILYIESDRNYITVVTIHKKLCFIDSLKNWTNKLQSTNFIRTHKSYIINGDYVDKISGNIVFISGHKIPIGRTYKADFLKQLQNI